MGVTQAGNPLQKPQASPRRGWLAIEPSLGRPGLRRLSCCPMRVVWCRCPIE